MQPFRAAVEARDMDAAVALLSDQVVFHSPIVFTPYRGREAVGPILRAVVEALVFRARVGEFELEGSDFLHLGADGSIEELTVMVRPIKAALALAEAMKAKLS